MTLPDGQPEEHALVERARRGDGDEYGELVIRYQGIATRTAYVITQDASEAEEAARDGAAAGRAGWLSARSATPSSRPRCATSARTCARPRHRISLRVFARVSPSVRSRRGGPGSSRSRPPC